MQAIILAGGFGTRLRSVVADVPKPMAPIGDKPFVALLMKHLMQFGVTEFVLSTHYLRQTIEDYFLNRFEGIPVRYAVEDAPLGTGGAIVHALRVMKADKPVLVVNGDTFVKLDYAAMYRQHVTSGEKLTMALRHIPDTGRSGVVSVDDAGRIVTFGERGMAGVSGLINAGVYVVSPELFAGYADGEAFGFEQDFMIPRVATLKPASFVAEDYFIDIGIPADYLRAQDELPRLV